MQVITAVQPRQANRDSLDRQVLGTVPNLIDMRGMPRYLNFVLALVAGAQLALCVVGLVGGFWLLSVILLISIVISNYVYQVREDRRESGSEEQIAARLSMLRDIKHKLDNDMQVVLGNSELAQIRVLGKDDQLRPVLNITAAANDAVERIEELSALSSFGSANPEPFNLNAMLRQKMARLAGEISPMVNLRLELEYLTSQVIADRHLLSLSLSNLVRQMAVSLQYGGEIVIKIYQDSDTANGFQSQVCAEVCISRAFNHSIPKEQIAFSHECLITSTALVERSGADNVHFSHTDNGCLFSMTFEQVARIEARRGVRLMS